MALAFGLSAASFFPVIVLGIFWKRANTQGAVAGMLVGLITASTYMWLVLYGDMEPWGGISAAGIGAISMVLNALTVVVVSNMTAPPPERMQHLVEEIRYPRVIDHTIIEDPALSSGG